mgnify:CR=1 FL=1
MTLRVFGATPNDRYGHTKTTVVLMTQFPDELPASFDHSRGTYASRGWTQFERCSSELGKRLSMIRAGWPLIIDIQNVHKPAVRRLPTVPDAMETTLKRCRWTNIADLDAVIKLYKKTAIAVLGDLRELELEGMEMQAGDTKALAHALGYCNKLELLNMKVCGLTDELLEEMVDELPPGSLPRLNQLALSNNHYSSKGVEAIGMMIAAGSMANVKMWGCDMGANHATVEQGDEAAMMLAGVLMSLPKEDHPCIIQMIATNIGSAGMLALVGAISATGSDSIINTPANPVPLHARMALFRVRGLSDRPLSIMELLFCQVMDSLPHCFYDGFAQGMRSTGESIQRLKMAKEVREKQVSFRSTVLKTSAVLQATSSRCSKGSATVVPTGDDVGGAGLLGLLKALPPPTCAATPSQMEA